MRKALTVVASMGASLSAGTAHLVYPTLWLLPPLLGYAAGAFAVWAIYTPPHQAK